MEFKNRQFDGPYEVASLDIYNKDELFKGVLYYPPVSFKKPYPVIIYFHGFPQLFTLQDIVKRYQFLLDTGFAFIAFNFRGYRYAEGKVSIKSQVADAYKVIDFINTMANNDIFNLTNVNIIAHDFGAYIALILCSQINAITKLLLISPILDLKKHIYDENFHKVLSYINRFLPGNVKGISSANEFIDLIKKELSQKEYQIRNFINHLKIKKLKIVIGDTDKITPISEVKDIMKDSNKEYELIMIDNMDHDIIEEGDLVKINKEVKIFFK